MKTNSKKRIAILYSGGKYFGGIEHYLLSLFNNIDKRTFDIELISLGDWSLTKQLKQSSHKVKIFKEARINPATIKAIGKYLKTHDCDLLVSQGTVANAYARAISLFYKITNLVTVHSTLEGDYKNILIKSVYGLIERITRFPTSRYIAVSEYIKTELKESGIPENKIDVVYNGLDFPPTKARSHKRLIIGSLGRLHPVKGYDLLIKAFALLDNKRLRLKIAGVGEELGNLKKIASDLSVSDRVEFVGFYDDVYEFLDKVDIYVQSSLSEGFGICVVQAMSCNLPVVVTPAGALVEIVQDGVTGYVSKDFSPESIKNSISKLLNSYEDSKNIGENAGKFVRGNFNSSTWIRKTKESYMKAIK